MPPDCPTAPPQQARWRCRANHPTGRCPCGHRWRDLLSIRAQIWTQDVCVQFLQGCRFLCTPARLSEV